MLDGCSCGFPRRTCSRPWSWPGSWWRSCGEAEAKPASEDEALADVLARVGGEHLQDLADDPQAVSALVRFLDAHLEEEHARLVMRLDADAIAALMKR